MNLYKVSFDRSALKFLKTLKNSDANRIRAAIELLRANPIPPRALKLSDREGYRVRVGRFRIIYSFRSDILLIRIIKIGQRKNVYEK